MPFCDRPDGGPVALSCIHSGLKPVQPRASISSAAAFGSCHRERLFARALADPTVSGERLAFRWRIMASTRSVSRTDASAARILPEEALASEGREGVISLGGVGDLSLGETLSAEFRSLSADVTWNSA